MSWKSASAGRRKRLPHLLSQTLDQQGGAGGFACRPKGDNPACSEISEFSKTGKHPRCPAAQAGQTKRLPGCQLEIEPKRPLQYARVADCDAELAQRSQGCQRIARN